LKREKKARKSLISWFIFIVVTLLIVFLFRAPLQQFWNFISDQQAVSDFLRPLGIIGPLVLWLLLVAQVFLAIIPGHVLLIAGGYVYGGWVSNLLVITSTVIGSQLAFILARRYGRGLIYRFASPESVERWDRIASRQGVLFFFITFVLPFFPSDLMCFVAGLGTISPGGFFLANLLGRSLCAVAMTLIGSFSFAPPPWFWFLFGGSLLLIFITWFVYKKRHGIDLKEGQSPNQSLKKAGKWSDWFNATLSRIFRLKKREIRRQDDSGAGS